MPRASKQQARYAVGRCLMLWSSNDVTQQGSRPKTKLVPSPALCAQPLISALRPVPKAFKPFGPPALVQQAPSAIILAVLRRFRGPAVFRGLRTSSRLGAPFWPSGLTLRSSGPAFCGPLTLAVRHHKVQHRDQQQRFRHTAPHD